MAYLNKVMLIGNLGKDPAISVTPTGRKRVSFSLATSRRYRDNNGEQKEQTDWHNIEGWGKVADTIESLHVSKGTTLYVEGTLTNRSWTDNQNQKRSMTIVSLDGFQLLTPRTQNSGSNQGAPSYNQATNNAYAQQTQRNVNKMLADEGVDYGPNPDEDLPF